MASIKVKVEPGLKIDQETQEIIESYDYKGKNEIFVNSYGTGGMSDARVYKIIPENSNESYIIKIGPRELIDAEYNNYTEYVKGKLKCVLEPIYAKRESKAGLLETKLDRVINYVSLSDFYREKGYSQIKEALNALFEDLKDWYEGSTEVVEVDTHSLFYTRHENEILEKWRKRYGDFLTFTMEELGISLLNPVRMFSVPSESLNLRKSFYHGDLRFQNIFVNAETKRPILIDFANTEVGYTLKDFIKLEASVKYELLKCKLRDFFRLEELLLMQDSFTPLRNNAAFLNSSEELAKAFNTIEFIRESAGKYAERYGTEEGFKEYQYLLLLQAFKFLSYDWASSDQRKRAHVSAHLLSLKLNSTLSRYVLPDVHVSYEQMTHEFDPFYDNALRILKEDITSLTLVQRTPSLLFPPQSEKERNFAEDLKNWISSCKQQKHFCNYIFSAPESSKKYNSMSKEEKEDFLKRLGELKVIEEDSRDADGNYHFRMEFVGEDRKVFGPMIVTDKESLIFLGENSSQPRSRRVISLGVSSKTVMEDLQDAIKRSFIFSDLQKLEEIKDLFERDSRNDLNHVISDQRHDLFTMGREIARKSQTRLVIIERTAALVLGPEPIGREEKLEHQKDYVEDINEIAEKASRGELTFYYLWSKEKTQEELTKFLEDDKEPEEVKEEVKNEIRKNLQKLRKLEKESYRNGDYTFRFAAISSPFLGPLALGDNTIAFLFAETGSNAFVLRFNSRAVTDSVFERITHHVPSIKPIEQLYEDVGL